MSDSEVDSEMEKAMLEMNTENMEAEHSDDEDCNMESPRKKLHGGSSQHVRGKPHPTTVRKLNLTEKDTETQMKDDSPPMKVQTSRKKSFLERLMQPDEEQRAHCNRTYWDDSSTTRRSNSSGNCSATTDQEELERYGGISEELYQIYIETGVDANMSYSAANVYNIKTMDNILDCDTRLMTAIYKKRTDDVMRTLRYVDTKEMLCTAVKYFSEEVGEFNILFRNDSLNFLLGDGIMSGDIIEFYGSSGAGKSHIVQHLAIESIQMAYDVIILDTERKISEGRFTHLCRRYKVTAEKIANLMIHKVKNQNRFYQSLTMIRKQLKERPPESKGTLIVLDSISSIFRMEYAGQKNVTKRSEVFTEVIGELKEIVTNNPSVAIIYTNQVAASYKKGANHDRVTPLGGEVLKHGTVTRVYVTRKNLGYEMRYMVLENSNRQTKAGLIFEITTDKALNVVREATSAEVNEILGVSISASKNDDE